MIGSSLRARPRLVIALAALAISLGLVLGLAGEVIAKTFVGNYRFGPNDNVAPFKIAQINWKDTDGKVPQYYAIVGGSTRDNKIGYTFGYAAGGVGFTPPQVRRWIHYDKPQMDRIRRITCGRSGGRSDWGKLRAHEHAHSRGWGHGERPASRNAAYNPTAFSYRNGC